MPDSVTAELAIPTAEDLTRPVAFIDFEASSLSIDSWPVAVAWAKVNGDEISSGMDIIRPMPDWIGGEDRTVDMHWQGWSDVSADFHSLTKEQLLSDGLPATDVLADLENAFAGHLVFADSGFDHDWLRQLAVGAGKETSIQLFAYSSIFDGLTTEQVQAIDEEADKVETDGWRAGTRRTQSCVSLCSGNESKGLKRCFGKKPEVILGRLFGKFIERHIQKFSKISSCVFHIGGLIAFPPIGYGSQIRAIGLNQKPI